MRKHVATGGAFILAVLLATTACGPSQAQLAKQQEEQNKRQQEQAEIARAQQMQAQAEAQRAAQVEAARHLFKSDPDGSLPRYSVSELADVFMSRKGGSQLEGKRIRLTGRIQTLTGNTVSFVGSPQDFLYLWFHINNLNDAELDSLQKGTAVEVVCTYTGEQHRTDRPGNNYASMTYEFEGEEIH